MLTALNHRTPRAVPLRNLRHRQSSDVGRVDALIINMNREPSRVTLTFTEMVVNVTARLEEWPVLLSLRRVAKMQRNDARSTAAPSGGRIVYFSFSTIRREHWRPKAELIDSWLIRSYKIAIIILCFSTLECIVSRTRCRYWFYTEKKVDGWKNFIDLKKYRPLWPERGLGIELLSWLNKNVILIKQFIDINERCENFFYRTC